MKIVLFGATGSAGGAVLTACIKATGVEEIRAVVRRPLVRTSAKVRAYVIDNFLEYSGDAEAFEGVDACLFCLGISVTQVSKEDYKRITHDYAMAAARMLQARSPEAAFHYISGQGTRDGSRMFWSRVKAQTELDLMNLVGAVCWRPAFIDAVPSTGLPKMYAAFYPILRLLKPFRSLYVSGEDIGCAMLQATKEKLRSRIVENAEIREIAARFRA